jgi:hypothetical protein
MVPFPVDPSPATLWALTNDGTLASCEVRFVPIGVEGSVLTNGRLLYSRTSPPATEALQWAEEERTRHLARGWMLMEATNR